MYALCDGNDFFVSCERVFDSSLDGKPVIVLSNNDGCIISRSSEAKALGIKMGVKFHEVEKFVKQHNVQVFSTNFVLYADMSMRMRGLLSRFAPGIENYSIDESFLDFTGFEKHTLRDHCLEMARTVRQGIGIPVSVGIAPTKTLAKLANRFAKKYAGYENVCFIDSDKKRIKALEKTEIGDIWGIGRRLARRLSIMGVKTAYDFTQLNLSWVRKHMTVTGERTWRELHGEPCIQMETGEPEKHSILVSRSFGKKTEDLSIIKEATATYACMATTKLRKQKSCAKSLLVFLETDPYREELSHGNQHTILTMPVATNSSMEIVHYVSEGLERIYLPGIKYKKSGVMLMDITSNSSIQMNCWDKIDREKHKRLMEVLDKTNDRYGRNTLKLAALGDGKEWKIKQERLSPSYTTRLSDFPRTKE